MLQLVSNNPKFHISDKRFYRLAQGVGWSVVILFGALILSLIFSYLCLELTTIFSYLKLNSINTLIFILLISLISQVGDIIISYFKRKSKIKNTGNIIPGHGGLLDRIDGMIFAFPFGYLFLSLEILK